MMSHVINVSSGNNNDEINIIYTRDLFFIRPKKIRFVCLCHAHGENFFS